ncbi:DNA-binding response regulator [Bacteroidia bacterium]|nr:DNA-binding response regulator [Bacteroidia bacterium]
MINVQIVDDHKILAAGLLRIINGSGVAEVSAIYYDLDSCRKGLISGCPDVLLLDVELPDGNGVDFCDEIKVLYPDLKIMMLTCFGEFIIAKRSLSNGALGYVLKNALPEELIAGIQKVNSGEKFLCAEMDMRSKERKDEQILYLTSREKSVLQLIAEGFTNPEIAGHLFLSKDSIKTYRRNLLMKFNAKNSLMMVQIAKEQKLI